MGKIGQSGTASGKFFQHADCHRRFLPSLLNVQIRAFWKPLSKFFCRGTMSSIVFREYYPHTGSAPFICPSISTWRKSAILETPEENFLPGRNSCCTFSQTPLTPTWEKSGKLTPPPEIFSARESSSNVQNRAFWKPLSKNFFKLLRTSINSHRSPMRIMPASSPVSGSILPASLLCENRSK